MQNRAPFGTRFCTKKEERIYTNKDMPMVALNDFAELGKTDKFYADLDAIVKANNGLWCLEAEKYVLANAKDI